jgi:SAM-dependent methyltransferase
MSNGEKGQKEQWEKMYQQKDFFGEQPSEFAVRAMEDFRKHGAKRVLELGCGQGRDSFYFIENGLDVVALDYSETGICQMAERAEKMKLGTRLGLKVHDLRNFLPLPNESVDAVYSHMFFTMELKEAEMEKVLQECWRVLRPNGLNIYSVRAKKDPHFQKGKHRGEDMWENPLGLVVHFFDEDKIKRLAKGYKILYIRETQDTSPPFTKELYEVALQKVGQ